MDNKMDAHAWRLHTGTRRQNTSVHFKNKKEMFRSFLWSLPLRVHENCTLFFSKLITVPCSHHVWFFCRLQPVLIIHSGHLASTTFAGSSTVSTACITILTSTSARARVLLRTLALSAPPPGKAWMSVDGPDWLRFRPTFPVCSRSQPSGLAAISAAVTFCRHKSQHGECC